MDNATPAITNNTRMEKRIALECGKRKPDEIVELILDNCYSTNVVGLTDEFVNLERLSLIKVGLTNLKNFPNLPNLTRLELGENRITSGLQSLQGSPKLAHLSLSNNRIKDLETLEPLSKLQNLKSLDLLNCEVTTIEGYRAEIFKMIPSLKYLDGYDRYGNEAEDTDSSGEEDGEEGKF